MENKEAIRIAVNCFIGATLGLIVACWINGNFWFIGALFGAIVAYLMQEWKKVKEGVSDSWGKVTAPKDWGKVRKRLGHLSWKYYKEMGISVYFSLGAFVFLFSFFFCLAFFLGVVGLLAEGSEIPSMLELFLFLFRFSFFCSALFCILLPFTLSKKEEIVYQEETILILKVSNWCFLYGNLIAIVIWAIIGLVKLTLYIFRNFKKISCSSFRLMLFTIKEIGKFFKRVLIYIHSDKRTLCFFWAFTATTIGYLFSLIIGFWLGFVICACVAVGGSYVTYKVLFEWAKENRVW